MAIGILENLRSSYEFTNSAFKTFGDWFILILISLLAITGAALLAMGAFGFILSMASALGVPGVIDGSLTTLAAPVLGMMGGLSLASMGIGFILCFIFGILLLGITIRVYRGGELKLGNWGSMFLDGLLATIISVIYMIPYVVISVALKFGPVNNLAYYGVSAIIEIIVLIVTMMFVTFALIRFAREQRFGAAFNLKAILTVISTIGWLRYLANIIVVGIVFSLIYLILCLILVVGWVLLLVIAPFLIIWEAKFFAVLYDSAVDVVAEE